MLGRLSVAILLFLMFFIIFLSVRVFLLFPSRIYRRQFIQNMRYSSIVGLALGLILPWNIYVGLVAAVFAALILLFISIFTLVVSGRIIRARFLHQTWIRRETVRESLIVFSIVSGIIGIIATILSIIIPPFLELSLSSEIPLAFDALSVTAALLDVTIPVTSYRKIYSLIYMYLRPRYGEEDWEWISDQHFSDIIQDTEFTEYEVRDALENLVHEGLAVKTSPEDTVERVIFQISGLGYEILRLNYDETSIKVHNRIERFEHGINLLETQLKDTHIDDKELQETIKQLQEEVETFYTENRCFDEVNECIIMREQISELMAKLEQK